MANSNSGHILTLVDRYIARFEDLAVNLGPIARFYAYQADELQALQWEIQELDPDERELHDRLLMLYAHWLDAMSRDEQENIFAYNRNQQGEWRSHLLEEELEPRYNTLAR